MIYQYKCECGNIIESNIPMKDYVSEVKCSCGKMAKRMFTPLNLSFWSVDHSQMNPDTAYKEMQECGVFE